MEDATADCGFAELLNMKSFPAAEPDNGIVDGAYLLQSLPIRMPVLKPFKPDSMTKLEKG